MFLMESAKSTWLGDKEVYFLLSNYDPVNCPLNITETSVTQPPSNTSFLDLIAFVQFFFVCVLKVLNLNLKYL